MSPSLSRRHCGLLPTFAIVLVLVLVASVIVAKVEVWGMGNCVGIMIGIECHKVAKGGGGGSGSGSGEVS
jgi:hypothetical protein